MLNDTIDILNAKIVNLGIEYIIKASPDFNRFEILENARRDLSTYFEDYHFEIGEALSISDIHNVLKRVRGVQDVLNVKVVRRTGSNYSDVFYDIKSNTSQDGRTIFAPENYIFEIKNEDLDIKGTVK